MRFILEPDKGARTRHTCPSCKRTKVFTKYIDTEHEINFPDDVGRCNRENSCSYHKLPSDYFNEHQIAPNRIINSRNSPHHKLPAVKETPNLIDPKLLDLFLKNLRNNELFLFLKSLFDEQRVLAAMRKYKVGTSKDGRPIFGLIDFANGIRSGKIMKYDSTSGRRSKEVFPSWVHSKLKLKDFTLIQGYLGEHLLNEPQYAHLPVGIVESEKTAIIASIVAPEFIWIATGGKHGVGFSKKSTIEVLKNRDTVLFPDADAYEDWAAEASLSLC